MQPVAGWNRESVSGPSPCQHPARQPCMPGAAGALRGAVSWSPPAAASAAPQIQWVPFKICMPALIGEGVLETNRGAGLCPCSAVLFLCLFIPLLSACFFFFLLYFWHFLELLALETWCHPQCFCGLHTRGGSGRKRCCETTIPSSCSSSWLLAPARDFLQQSNVPVGAELPTVPSTGRFPAPLPSSARCPLPVEEQGSIALPAAEQSHLVLGSGLLQCQSLNDIAEGERRAQYLPVKVGVLQWGDRHAG